MDVRDLKFETGYFDVAVDKSTIDALLCGNDAALNVAIMLREVQRVLAPSGSYVAISYGKPESRLEHFERKHLAFDLRQFVLYPVNITDEEKKEEKTHYIYHCTKKDNWEETDKLFDEVKEEIKIRADLEAAACIDSDDEEELEPSKALPEHPRTKESQERASKLHRRTLSE